MSEIKEFMRKLFETKSKLHTLLDNVNTPVQMKNVNMPMQMKNINMPMQMKNIDMPMKMNNSISINEVSKASNYQRYSVSAFHANRNPNNLSDQSTLRNGNRVKQQTPTLPPAASNKFSSPLFGVGRFERLRSGGQDDGFGDFFYRNLR
ncbi:hypothetical protein AVEN_5777-1 [Araneus ventricosus]|uniref:Uncharacterized protein n=1 Tax=Araneus ventricosus TaxID=182803 RepID=A0A4Y2DZJ3_ARAVE|nr:hypothetical protein AVEN_5777-1 [Araneus ventricosus]